MDSSEIEKNAEWISNMLNSISEYDANYNGLATIQYAKQFLADYGGSNNEFLKALEKTPFGDSLSKVQYAGSIMHNFANYLKSGLYIKISPLRQAQIEIVSDFLEQANNLLEDKKIHPAAPAVLIGAALEEFLRNWVEDEKFSLETIKPTIDSYAKLLREKELITKQDKKDIDSWAGNRNNAGHGLWDEVKSRELINIMLQGVNLFMRKYSPELRKTYQI